MTDPLRVLIVEDSPDDAELVLRELRRRHDPVHFQRVEDAPAMREALRAGAWDVIISDWRMPTFSAPAALGVLKEMGLDLPFIIASGSIGEAIAVEAMRAGAHDYVLKDKLARLPAAVEREMRLREERELNRRREMEHRKLERRYERMIETATEGIFLADAQNRFTFASRRLEEMLGYEPGELIGQPISVMLDDADRPRADRDMEARRRGIGGVGEFRLKRKDGGHVWTLRSSNAIMDDQGHYDGLFGMLVDITDRKKTEDSLRQTEEQLRQAQKMEAVGSLAGGVAHDFNNLLSVILSYSTMLAEDMTTGDPRRADLLEIEAAGKRAVELTRQLLAFSRKQVLQPRVLNLNDLVTGVERMLGRLIGADIQLTVLADPDLKRVRVDPSQIEQVIMNLAVNARDAMPQGGKLTIETANVELDETYATTHVGIKPGPHVMLAVTDSGTGMDKATLARMFEPFFTTKGVGKGTGLGLATVFGIVRQSEGSIWVYSELGKGTTFKVYLPRAGSFDSDAPTPAAAHGAPAGGTETILLVEDEDAVRVLARTILRRLGYHVLDAQSGGDALLICEQHTATIDLLLTDVVMGRMSGRQLSERLRPLRPDMKVLFMSGYTDDAIVHHGVLDSSVAFLQKPFTPATLGRRVREVLDAPECARA